jgi:hypothetical protein
MAKPKSTRNRKPSVKAREIQLQEIPEEMDREDMMHAEGGVDDTPMLDNGEPSIFLP